jgi:hypothetical protein
MNGRVLKIKTGYNPNSSSIGVDLVVFFTAGAALTLLFNTVAAIVAAKVRGEPPADAPARAPERDGPSLGTDPT